MSDDATRRESAKTRFSLEAEAARVARIELAAIALVAAWDYPKRDGFGNEMVDLKDALAVGSARRLAVPGSSNAPCAVCGMPTIERLIIGDGFAPMCSRACELVFDERRLEGPTPVEEGFVRNTWQSEARRLREEVARLRSFAEDLAEHDCAYGDECPTFGSRHGQCVGCKARAALRSDGAPLLPTSEEDQAEVSRIVAENTPKATTKRALSTDNAGVARCAHDRPMSGACVSCGHNSR
jgi:hypothetical protein